MSLNWILSGSKLVLYGFQVPFEISTVVRFASLHTFNMCNPLGNLHSVSLEATTLLLNSLTHAHIHTHTHTHTYTHSTQPHTGSKKMDSMCLLFRTVLHVKTRLRISSKRLLLKLTALTLLKISISWLLVLMILLFLHSRYHTVLFIIHKLGSQFSQIKSSHLIAHRSNLSSLPFFFRKITLRAES
jgi:hypothetical protein